MISNRNALMLGVAIAALLATSLLWRRAADVMPIRPSASAVPAQREEAPAVESESIALEPQLAERIDARAATITSDSSTVAMDVRGRVVDELKRPIVFFGLRAIHRDENNWFVEKREWPVELHKDGEFDLPSLVVGRWEIAPFAKGLQLKNPIEFTHLVEQRINFEMTGVATIAGFVLDPDGQPVADAVVTVDGDARELRTTVGGAFDLEVRPGTHRIRARRRGFAPSTELEINLGTRDLRNDIRLSLQRGALLNGSIVNEAGQPLAHLAIVHESDGLPYQTDDAGRFAIAGIEPGLVHLAVSRPDAGAPVMHALVEVKDDETKEVRLKLGRERRVHLVGEVKKSDFLEQLDLGVHYATFEDHLTWRVEAAAFEDRLTTSQVYRAEIDANGRFELELPTFGHFLFRVDFFAHADLSFTDDGFGARVLEIPDRDEFEVTLAP